MDDKLYKLNATKTYAIICILSSNASIFDILGESLQKAGKIGLGYWIGLKGGNSEYHTKDLRESRIRKLLGLAQNMTTGELIDTVREIGEFQCADAISDVINGTKTVQKVAAMPNGEPLQKKVGRKYETVSDLIDDEDNFGLIIMNLYLQLENLWEKSMTRFIELGIDIPIDQNTMSQKKMKGKFYLESLRNIKLSDFLSNLDAIGCQSVKDIDSKLQELNTSFVREKKEVFSGKNEVAKWCSENNLSHLYDQLIGLGFDSLEKLKCLDDQSCTEMDIKGFPRIELMKKVNLLKN